MAGSAAARDQTQAQIPDRVQDIRQKSSLVVIARRVEYQAVCLRNVEFRSSGLAYRRVRFGCMGFRSADTDMSAVVDDVASVAGVEGAVATAAAVIAVVVIVAGPDPGDLRADHLDRIASTFFVVSCQKTIQNGSKSFALSG